MTAGPQAAWLPGRNGGTVRLHLQHGPIDLIVGAFGAAGDVARAYAAASARFADILETLVGELPVLRAPLGEIYPLARGPVARRMVAACWPYRDVYLTPMAAVAGSVADEILAAMRGAAELSKAYVNNGGDIAFHLDAGQSLHAALVCNPDLPHLDAVAKLDACSPARAIATSGWRGRSHSLGIADAATVLARSAAAADAAATIVANAVNVDDPAIRRVPAEAIVPDSDLGAILVTVAVGALDAAKRARALAAGAQKARDLLRLGLIDGAFLSLQGDTTAIGGDMLAPAGTATLGAS
jgi:ApbE superfamily uncharacterized protein (UPF0280 family)